MDMVKKLFPYSFGTADVKSLVIKILVYLVASAVVGFLLGLLSGIPLVGAVAGVIGWAFGLYCTVGWILAILNFLKVLK
jgi:VIT1/CCC1 family predicted Fe2+/Mn2+ transporter